jgi:glycosyltransferase involved in cell wall biosynthesis
VNPSHSEGSPYVLLEAMAANLPIVATAVGGVPEMLENNETALLVPSGNPRALADAIARVLTDEELAQTLSANALRLGSSRFSPESYARSLTNIYREVINDRFAAEVALAADGRSASARSMVRESSTGRDRS